MIKTNFTPDMIKAFYDKKEHRYRLFTPKGEELTHINGAVGLLVNPELEEFGAEADIRLFVEIVNELPTNE